MFIIFVSGFSIAQETDSIINTKFINSVVLEADEFIGIDEFENLYYLKNNTLYKKSDKAILSYTNTHLGKISSVDIKNPLKILLFYKDFNTVILLDNKLNELSNRVDFNEALFSKNVSLVAGSSNNNLWLYSSDDNKLHLYNYKTSQIVSVSAPINFYESDFEPNRMFATYKNCWLINENTVLQYDEYGNFKQRLKLKDMYLLNLFNNRYYWVKDGILYFSDLESSVYKVIFKNSITIESFYVLNDEIFIFDGEKLLEYKTVKN
ncbi:hypothetical protein [Aureibaculum sp. 2210JD6-5]|uniref:hypothetical protein n=1 Tax=Aureibaculum sp. 2210JD6-5 TaxID=3103957 RepID=UPI002ABD5DC9|nr:hypothetical protein [Aureibaculum sp. 2210JD6-5]